MKTLTLLAISIGLFGCSNLTPEQAQQYENVAQTVIDNTIQDYKEVRPLLKK